MKKIIVTLFLLILFSQSFAQHNIEYKFKIKFQASQHIWSTITVIDSGSFVEGSYYTIPAFTMPEAQSYLQPAYNAIVGATFGIDDGAINNDIRLDITLNGIALDGHYKNIVDGQTLFLVLDVDVYNPINSTEPLTEHFWFNAGHSLTFTIPLHDSFLSYIKSLDLLQADLAFAYIENGQFLGKNIETIITTNSISFSAEHLSSFAGGGAKLVDVKDKQNNVIPTMYRLEQNYPNPFNPTTKIKYSLPESGFVSLNIHNILGAMVTTLVSDNISPGSYEVEFNAKDLPTGIYFYTLVCNNVVITKKMILLK